MNYILLQEAAVQIALIIIAVLLATIQMLVDKRARTLPRTAAIYLVYLLAIGVGLGGVLGFLGHTIRAGAIATYIGWPPGNPFQFEVAMANLAIGVLGLLCIRFHDNFQLATIIAASVFLLGAAYGHFVQIYRFHDYAPGNAGLVLYYNIILPVLLIILWVISRQRDGSPSPNRQQYS